MSYYFFDYKIKVKVKKYLGKGRFPDIVITDSDREMYYFLKYNENNSKTILFMHTDGIPLKMKVISDPFIERTFFFKRLKRRYEYTIQNVDRIIFICNVGKNNFMKSYPNFDINKLNVVLNGIEKKEIQYEENKPLQPNSFKYNLCCVGSLSNRKGQDIILKALSTIDHTVLENIHVDLIGDSSERKYFENYIRGNNLSSNVSIIGGVDNLEIRKFLERSDIFILMSRNEGLPISIIEAMREGLPIISTNISGIPELVENGINGVLLDPDINQLRGLFMRLDEYNWKEMGISSKQIFNEKFALNRVLSEYCDIYDSLF